MQAAWQVSASRFMGRIWARRAPMSRRIRTCIQLGPPRQLSANMKEYAVKMRWLIVAVAGLVVLAAWSAVAITYFFFHPALALWTGVVTAAALALEGFFWVCAGVLG